MSNQQSNSSHSNTVVITPYNTSDSNDNGSFIINNIKRNHRKCCSNSTLTKTSKTLSCLLGCVVFLMVLCACLVAALVLVGRHVMAAIMAGHNNGGFDSTQGAGFILEGSTKIAHQHEDVFPQLFRLPKDTRPIHYDVTLMPDLQNATFKGKIKIIVKLIEDRSDILMHSHQLLIDKIYIEKIIVNDSHDISTTFETSSNELNYTADYLRMSDSDTSENTTNFSSENYEQRFIQNDKNITVTGFELLEEPQMLRINFKDKLAKGLYEITFEYQGDMKNKVVGFHYVQYKAKINGTMEIEERPIATTKFEPTYARQAYPCFDEPNLKATYKVHLLKPKEADFIALSNMPTEGDPETTAEGIMVHFQVSKPMSTYLVCFIVTKMSFEEDTFGPDNKKLRVYATPGQEEKTKYALATGKKIIQFYATYFDIEYPLPKLDMAAIPDFVSGAMENWGLVTYRETALLYDPLTSSEANRARIADVVAHELAHSWFGNLVTMDWWDDLWLNEGFASYIAYKGVEAAQDGVDDWQMMDQFLTADMHDVLVLDATTASHPIVQKADSPDEITAMFDTISYKKGAAILRMLEDSITADKFKQGVTSYLKNNSYENAITKDFWDEMDAVSEDGVDIPAIMATWTTQMGYPVIKVVKSGSKYILTQERYLTNSKSSNENIDYKWTIPITYITNKDNSVPKIRQLKWLGKDQTQLEIDIPADTAWMKFNFHQIGYYRVNYPKEEWDAFATALKNDHTAFDASDRANLVEESFRLAESGHVSYTVPLELSKYLVKETDFIVWTAADKVFSQLKKYLFKFASNEDYQSYVASLIKPLLKDLRWEEATGESHLRLRSRTLALSVACNMGDSQYLKDAQHKFQKWLQTNVDELPQNIRAIIYSYGIQRATTTEWRQVLEKFKISSDANEKSRLLDALSRVRDAELLQSLILFAQDRNNIRDQDYFTCMALISNNPSGTALVWSYVRSNWLAIVDRFGLNERNLGRMIPQITKSFSTEIELQELQTFFENYPDAGAGEAARQEAIETISNNIKWVDQHEKIVSDWISKNKPAKK